MERRRSFISLVAVLFSCWINCWGQTEIFVPQIVAGNGISYSYLTRLHLVNLKAVPVSGTVETRLNNAANWPVFSVENEYVSTMPFNLPALGESTLSLSSSEPLNVGWARILSSGPVAAVATLTEYSTGVDPQPITSTSIIPDDLISTFSAYARISEKRSTGFAVLNPSLTNRAEVTFRLFDQMGTAGNERQVVLEPGTKIARFLKEDPFFPNLSSFEGTIEVSSTQPVSAAVILVEGAYWSSFGVFPSRIKIETTAHEVLPNVIDIDFSAFPDDPENHEGPEVFVSLLGNDQTGDGSSGNPYRTIAHALSNSESGQVITVRGGTYLEGPDDEFRALILEQDTVVVRAADGESVTVKPRSEDITYGFELSASHVVIDGISLSGFSSVGIALGDTSGTQQDVVLKNLTVTMARPEDGIVMYSDFTGSTGQIASDGLLIKNVTVTGAGLGISCNAGPCNNWKLENVTVTNSSQGGGSGADAIAVENGDNFVFFGGDVSGADADGIDIKADRALVYNAHVHHVQRNAVKLWRNGEIINSLLHHSGADASIVFESGPRLRIVNTIVAYHNYGQGESYVLTSGYDSPNDPIQIDMINSVFFNNSGGIYFAPGNTVSIQNCLFTSHENGKVMDVSSRTTSERLEILFTDDISVFMNHNIGSGNLAFNTDPGFLNPSGGNFSFTSQSPLVDAGTNPFSFPSFDRLFNPRIQGSAPDLGPDELF